MFTKYLAHKYLDIIFDQHTYQKWSIIKQERHLLMLMFVYISLLLLIIISKQQCSSADIGNGAVLVSTNIMDLMMYVDAEDRGISQTIREKGVHNRELVDLLCKFVKNQESVVHVGAHIGLQTFAIGKYIKNNNFTNSFVYSFEPNQLNYILLIKSVYINDLQDIIHVYKTAISNEQGQSQIAVRNSDTSLAEIVFNSTTKRKADYKYLVTTTTVDKVLRVQINEGIKFGLFYISCNTFEIQALMGMKQILADNREAGIFVHWLFGKNPHKNVDVLIVTLKQFQLASYQLFVVEQNHIGSGEIEYRFRKLDNFMDIIKIHEANLLFVPPSKIKNIEK